MLALLVNAIFIFKVVEFDQVKFSLCNVFHKPKNSIVLILRNQFLITSAGDSGLDFCYVCQRNMIFNYHCNVHILHVAFIGYIVLHNFVCYNNTSNIVCCLVLFIRCLRFWYWRGTICWLRNVMTVVSNFWI